MGMELCICYQAHSSFFFYLLLQGIALENGRSWDESDIVMKISISSFPFFPYLIADSVLFDKDELKFLTFYSG